MKKASIKNRLIALTLAGAVIIPGSTLTVNAEESKDLPDVGIESVLKELSLSETNHFRSAYLTTKENEEYLNMAFADVEDFAYIRKAPSESSDWVGKIYQNDAAQVICRIGNWAEIQSGDVEGYVLIEDLLVGEAARDHVLNVAPRLATVTAYALNVRDGQGTDAAILTCIHKDEQYQITGEAVEGWYPVKVGELDGWVSGKYITVDKQFTYAESKQAEEIRLLAEKEERRQEAARAEQVKEAAVRAQVTQEQILSGQAIIDFACQFIGNPYVWGGTSLTDGADCSGFIQSVYKHFGVQLPRTSREMRGAGYEVSYENAMPGDIICYEGHVGLYMGDGTIVNAIDQAHGIGISNATYTNIITVRRMF